MRRIAIVGPTAAGKSTLARRLGWLLGIPVYHLDALYWKPGRVPTPEDEWDRLLERIVASDAWIVDGNFTKTMHERVEAADTVIYIDLPRIVSMASAIRRRALYPWRPAPGMAVGCRPMFNLRLFRWIWTFPEDHRPVILEMLAGQPADKIVLILRSRREVRRFLSALGQELESQGGGRG